MNEPVNPARPSSRVTILIKALNEEKRIAACIEAALREAAAVGGDVLLVDSLSTDRTVAIASQYPIRIVQFEHVADRGCGAAVQLGYQYVDSPFVYVLDADMELQPGFLAEALVHLEVDSGLAGVGGKLIDKHISSASDARRFAAANSLVRGVEVNELGGGGLYRYAAVQSVGYLAHRWLAAFEEAELGMRLCSAGWRLLRLPTVAVVHEGHSENNLTMLLRLWRNGRAQAGGMLLRSAWRQPWFFRAVRKQAYLFAVPIMHIAALLCAMASFLVGYSVLGGFFLTWIFIFFLMIARKASFNAALESLVLWHFFSVATMVGVFYSPQNPMEIISSLELKK